MSLANDNEKQPTTVCNESTELQSSETKNKKQPCEENSDSSGNKHRGLE
jgi:hypothetical protein